MKNKIFIIFVLIPALFTSFGGQVTQAAGEMADPLIAIHVVPAITDVKILPTSSISSSYISDKMSVVASPGEYEPASFVIHAHDDIASLEVEASDLRTGANVIPSSNVDIRVVKHWYQAGTGNDLRDDFTSKFFTPELLLKDDSLVTIENEENYVWNRAIGDYTWISERQPVSRYSIQFGELSIEDSEALQPVNIPAGHNKQFWVTVKSPDGQFPGVYTGTIQLTTGATLVADIQLQVEVLPFTLAQPYLTYSLYHLGRLDSDVPGISSYQKTEEQFRAELSNMIEHGVTNPQTSYSSQFERQLAIRQELGMANQPLYLLHSPFSWSSPPQTPDELEVVKTEVRQIIEVVRSYGVTGDVYFYGIDEAQGDQLIAERPVLQAIHEAGGKVYITGWKGIVFPVVGDLVDLFIAETEPTTAEAADWHSVGHKIFNYANPQAGLEKPETYRRNFGLLLWQANYDGAMNFAYQWSDMTNPWNDFDAGLSEDYRDHNFTYPTTGGVVDTIQWEGWREGVDDVRYLTTLLEAIEVGKAEGRNTSTAEDWLADLKGSDLTTENLDTVRSKMINHILSLQNHAPVLSPIGDKTVDRGELLTFTISATDPDGDALAYSASSLPQGASFDPETQSFSWMPSSGQGGVYPNIHFEISDPLMTLYQYTREQRSARRLSYYR